MKYIFKNCEEATTVCNTDLLEVPHEDLFKGSRGSSEPHTTQRGAQVPLLNMCFFTRALSSPGPHEESLFEGEN